MIHRVISIRLKTYLLIPAVVLATLRVSARVKPHSRITIQNAHVRAADKGMTSAAYFKIVNNSSEADTLYGAKADFCEMAQLHESYEKDGLTGMRRVDYVVVPGKGDFSFKQGGYHVMLMNLTKDLRVGMTVIFELLFRHAGMVRVKAVVRR